MMHFSVALVTTYGLLALAFCAVWFPAVTLRSGRAVAPWVCLLVLACASGAVTGLAAWTGILAIAALGALAYCAKQAEGRVLKPVLLIATVCMVLALSLHRFPGFVNPPLVTDLVLSAMSAPLTHRLNFDKASAGLILFALFCTQARSREQWRAVGRHYWIILGVPLLVLSIGMLIGYVAVDVKLLAYTPVFLVLNLLFTCVTEEAFFRGFIQQRLGSAMGHWPAGPYVAMGVAAVLFGLAHAGGGPMLILVATLAGLGYGYAYLRSQRIETAILTHLALNGLHFIAFTYPHVGAA
jgi:membrane protease YdiL (CAAX protease family)